MRLVNKLYRIVLPVLLLAACKQPESLFSSKFVHDDRLGTQLPANAFAQDPKNNLLTQFSSRKVYRLVFEQKYVNSNSVLQTANLPAETPFQTETYYDPKGSYQELYLVKYETDQVRELKDAEGNLKKDTLHAVMFAFYSFKYDADDICRGAGPVRLGRMETYRINKTSPARGEMIRLNYEVGVGCSEKNSRDLNVCSIKESREPVLFVLKKDNDEQVVVEKIVADHTNKVGGKKAVIYDMNLIMPGGQLLNFSRVKTK